VRLLTIAVLQPIVSPLLSISCRLTTPYIRPFWFKNDGTVVTLTRTTCDASRAAMVRSSCTLVPVRCSVNCRNCARASCTIWCGDTRGLCAQHWFGWVTNVFDYRSSGAALCYALSHQHWWTHPSSIVVPHALAVAEPCGWNGAGRLARCHSFESQTVWWVLHRRAYSAAHGCASNARGCRFRLRRECAPDVRTSKLRPCPDCNGSHGILATLG
jgi:hypothetical protein